MESGEFRLSEYHRFLKANQSEIASFRSRQQQAFSEERARWAKLGEFNESSQDDAATSHAEQDIPPGCFALRSPATASVWRLETETGKHMEAGQRAILLEAMKMEIAVSMPRAGEVVDILCRPGTMVIAGQPLLVYRPHV
jgi:urea carboxylase